jgi:hypothetical protein
MTDTSSLNGAAPLKVTKRTKELVRLGAAAERCTQGEFVRRAVDAFIEAHADELRARLASAKEALGV